METKSGFAKKEDYKNLIESKGFKEMEVFSNKFLDKNKEALGKYIKKWVKDPLHQWSRQWEYPFVYNEIKDHSEKHKEIDKLKILDAGSGITFFPYYVSEKIANAEITCCDYDEMLKNIYTEINKTSKSEINLDIVDIHKLPYQDNSFDIIYCISVLEHLKGYPTVIQEFKRILKKDGKLIITFDISPDGTADISPQEAQKLLNTIHSEFKNFSEEELSIDVLQLPQDIVTTKYIKEFDKSLLPWKYPAISNLKSLLKLKIPKGTIRDLTFYCGSFKK